jgi:outer membrane biosynthesis protein TonB
MNRLQKKCFIAAAGFHVLLALVLLVGPGFLSPPPKTEDVPVLDFIPVRTVDDLVSGGGNPNAKPPAALPVPPQAQPTPQPQPAAPKPLPEPEPDPQPAPSKQTVPKFIEEDGMEPAKRPKPRTVEINKTLITRKRDTSAADKRAKEEAQEQAKAAEDARRRLARQIGQVAETIGNEVSGGTSIELKGPGGGGLPYADWRSAIKTLYERAWLLPEGVADDDAVTVASVTIARDGKVLSSFITRHSSDPIVDRSVQAALDRVSTASPLPDTATESKRTITINFSVKAKRALG